MAVNYGRVNELNVSVVRFLPVARLGDQKLCFMQMD